MPRGQRFQERAEGSGVGAQGATPIAVIARLGRAHAHTDRALHAVFAEYGLTRLSFDVLASLRRIGAPYQLTPTALHQALMRTSGAITHTLHQLEYAGLIERVPNALDGRSVLVALTPAGVALVDRVGPEHLANERRMLAPLTADEQATLATLLRTLLIAFEREQATGARGPTPSCIERREDQLSDCEIAQTLAQEAFEGGVSRSQGYTPIGAGREGTFHHFVEGDALRSCGDARLRDL